MKKKNDLIVVILSSAVCLLPLILSFAVYEDLPQEIAVHWGISGSPDGYAPKAFAAFGLPFVFFASSLLVGAIIFNDPKRSNTSRVMQLFSIWMMPLLSLILVPVTLFIAMGVNISINLIVPVLVGIVFIICGNYLPKSRQNYTIGIRLPWTLHSADNWNKTHRLAGYLYILGGIVLIAGTFISGVSGATSGLSLTIPIIILLVIIPLIYSWLLYKKAGENAEETDDPNRRT